jgi:hypothetical protein
MPDFIPQMASDQLKKLKAKLATPKKGLSHLNALGEFQKTDFGTEAIPVLRNILKSDDMMLVGGAAICIAKLGPQALTSSEGQGDEGACYECLASDLEIAGSRIWSHTGYCNCYSPCLDALVKIGYDSDALIDYVHHHIGLNNPADLVHSLEALKTIGTTQAIDLFKRAIVFWEPELNKSFTKQVQKLAATVK